jgi:hypothetical protein
MDVYGLTGAEADRVNHPLVFSNKVSNDSRRERGQRFSKTTTATNILFILGILLGFDRMTCQH